MCGTSPQLAQARGEVDLALIEEPQGSAGGQCLAVDRLLWIRGSGAAAHHKRPLPLCPTADTCAFRALVIEALHGRGIGWRAVLENDHLEATRSSVRAGLAVTAWPALKRRRRRRSCAWLQ